MDTLYIVMPAYNEAENIDAVIQDWYPIVERHSGEGKSRLVIVNDGSKDSTLEKARSMMADRPLLEVLDKPNSGHGPTVIFAYGHAIKAGADYIFQTDSDGQTNPTEFEQFWEERNAYDAVIGSRSARQDGASRKFVEETLKVILWMTFRVRVPDSNAPFRLMKRQLVEKYIGKLPKDFNLPNVMLTTYFAYFKEKVKFIEITFKPRQAGTNSINIKRIVKIGWKALGDFRHLKKDMKNVRENDCSSIKA